MQRHSAHCTSWMPCWLTAAPGLSLPLQMDPKRFVGLESVADAVEWLQSGQSVGKVHVQVAQQLPTSVAAATAAMSKL